MKKLAALLLALVMMLTCTLAGAETAKHERVYVVASANGTVNTLIDSVRLENADGLDVLTDRTSLTDIENVSGHETFAQDGETLTWQANGSSIRYQGNGTEAPAVLPIVTYTVDGKEISAEEAASAVGRMTITVSYQLNGTFPVMVASVLPVPEGATNIELENAYLLDEGTAKIIVGAAVPGVDESLNLPVSFTVTCDADHADFSWMMTAATSDPLQLISDKLGETVDTEKADALLADTITVLTALQNGETIPETDGDLKDAVSVLNQLLDGTAQLASGAAQVSDGAVSLQTGAETLQTGLSTLTASNDTLNAGASQIFDAILATANAQIASSGLAENGITVPELTAENYADTLTQVIATLQAAVDGAQETARAQVAQAVEAQDTTIRAAVTEAVQANVLTAVLASAGISMTAEEYDAAVKAGKIPADQQEQISAAVEQQMATEEVKAQLEAAVTEQKNALIEQNLASDDVQNQIRTATAPAQAGIETLTALKTQLDSVSTFVTGLATYTAGVSQAAAGADALKTGTDTLVAGTQSLSDGAATLDSSLRNGLKEAAGKVLPYVQEDLTRALNIFEQTRANLGNADGYDLAADDMAVDTVYIIRTTMNK